ncbi:MAG: FHA domain-containing protein, partial [Anaerolineae bacterium]|nr:FHA domain-containing protein [Anaerolineae bacterium]
MKNKLDQLEAKLQSLVEDQLVGILPGLHMEDRIIQRLSSALKQNIVENSDEGAIAPNVYTLIVAPDSSPMWKEQSTLDVLKNIISTAGKEVGLKFTGAPTITITTDEKYSSEDISVVASHRLEPVGDTKGMPNKTTTSELEEGEAIPENAFLIIEGVKVYSLIEPVVNVGRRLENHLVIDDPRVSRNHAQLRSIKGRFVLFDLNSTGGTFVNGQRTSQTVLYPGDVISLAGVALIFGQDNPPVRPDLAETSPLEGERNGTSERPTASVE